MEESGRIFGYARVSSKEQNLDRQQIALEKYVLEENILIDKASGSNLERKGYQALKVHWDFGQEIRYILHHWIGFLVVNRI